MKKFISIALIALLFLNVLGYYGLFLGLEYQNKQSLIQRLDVSDYNESEAIMLKIPITIPYATDRDDFQRVDGEFEYQGEFYHTVKNRLSQDTLYVVCVKDNTSKRIHQALEDYVKSFTDKPVDAKSAIKTMPTFGKEYVVSDYDIKNSSFGWMVSLTPCCSHPVFVNDFYSSIIHPPERF